VIDALDRAGDLKCSGFPGQSDYPGAHPAGGTGHGNCGHHIIPFRKGGTIPADLPGSSG
jgi:hypothetical protein